MRLNISMTAGRAVVTDADTGKVLDWVDTVEMEVGPGLSNPILRLGTYAFSATIQGGPQTATPTPTPTPTATPAPAPAGS